MVKLADLAARPDFEAGALLVSPSRRSVRGPRGEIHLEPRIMQVFLLLVDAAGRVVTRNEIFDQCWGGTMVGDDSLNRAIAGVRRIASEVAPGAFEIETIPRTGYRLIGEILSEVGVNGEPPLAGAPPGRMTRRMVTGGATAAVAAAGLWGYFASRGNPEFDRLVGRADQILRYDVPQTGVQAIALLRRAVRIEPRDAKAWGLLAYALATSGDDDEPRSDAMATTEDAVRTALLLDSREPNALLARFMIKNALRDWTESDRSFRTILELDPGNAFAMRRLVALLQAAGMNRESWKWNERAIAIDPTAPIHQYRKALKYWIFGQTQKADAIADTLMLRWPTHPWVWNARFLIYALTGRSNAALDMLNDDQARPKTITSPAVATWRLSLAALDTRSPQAIAAARDASLKGARIGPGLAAYGAMIMSELGEVDAAFQIMDGLLLGRGSVITRQRRAPGQFVHTAGWRLSQWMFTPATAAVRADPRFPALCDGIGLVDYWRRRGVRPDYQLAQA